jgi:hypothetical protein
MVNSPECERCKQASKQPDTFSVTEALVTLRYRDMGCHCMKPGSIVDISVSKILHFVQGAGMLYERAQGLHNQSIMVKVHGSLDARPSVFYSFLLNFWKCESNNIQNNFPFEVSYSRLLHLNESVRTCKGFTFNYVAKYTKTLKCNNYLTGCHTATNCMLPARARAHTHTHTHTPHTHTHTHTPHTHTPFLSLNAIYGNIRNFINTNKCRKCCTTCTVLSSGNYNITSHSHCMFHFS